MGAIEYFEELQLLPDRIKSIRAPFKQRKVLLNQGFSNRELSLILGWNTAPEKLILRKKTTGARRLSTKKILNKIK